MKLIHNKSLGEYRGYFFTKKEIDEYLEDHPTDICEIIDEEEENPPHYPNCEYESIYDY